MSIFKSPNKPASFSFFLYSVVFLFSWTPCVRADSQKSCLGPLHLLHHLHLPLLLSLLPYPWCLQTFLRARFSIIRNQSIKGVKGESKFWFLLVKELKKNFIKGKITINTCNLFSGYLFILAKNKFMSVYIHTHIPQVFWGPLSLSPPQISVTSSPLITSFPQLHVLCSKVPNKIKKTILPQI